ncbi:hypothetical protein [Enterovibrio coralii]|nr:hypothetical protein [Enterovibrio coralii]
MNKLTTIAIIISSTISFGAQAVNIYKTKDASLDIGGRVEHDSISLMPMN